MPVLDWLGKDKVINHHLNAPFHFLDKKFSVGDSQNKIIHGDNLLALKSLLPEYVGKVKCIYIDPPYNTGNEGWIYNDAVNDPHIKRWLGQVVGREGEDLTRHDKWLCMMYPRLRLLQRLLSDDGAIFISIDDNEQANLKLICDEIFGAQNFINMFVWKRNSSAKTEKNKFAVNTEFVYLYAKSAKFMPNDVFKPLSESTRAMYTKDDNDGRGKYRLYPLQKPASPGPETSYDYVDNNGKIWKCPPKGWRMKFEKLKALENDGRLCLENNSLYEKAYWNERANVGKRTDTLWNDLPENTTGSKELAKAFGAPQRFEGAKPTEFISRCLQIATDKDSLILDSFAGSGTTAHAVINLNAQDGGNRRFILIELMDYAVNITAERVKRVGGSFDFYELGEPLFDDDGFVNQRVDREKLFDYVYFSETGKHCAATDEEFLLGVDDGIAYYYFPDCELNYDLLATIRTRAAAYVIYADNCTLNENFLDAHRITFKKIPSDIRVY